MESFFPFFITLFSGLLISSFFKRFHVPWVIALILAGIVIGPFGLKVFEANQTIQFISNTGLVLLMFMAGLETKLSAFKGYQKRLLVLSFINGFVPFLAGYAISQYFNLGYLPSMLVGIIFVSSSIAVVIPSLEASGLIETPLGASVVAISVIQDIASLVLLSVFLQAERPLANLPLIIFYPLLIGILVSIRYLLPRLQNFILSKATEESHLFHRDIRAVLLVLFGIVILFEILGLHPIIAGFFAGLVLSDSLESEILHGKIRAISYGIFIPTFFIIVGTETDISLFYRPGQSLYFTAAVVLGAMLSKLASGSLGAKLVGFNKSQSVFFAVSSVPQLSTTLAAAFTGRSLGILENDVVTSMVALSMISTILGSMFMELMNSYVLSKKDVKKTPN